MTRLASNYQTQGKALHNNGHRPARHRSANAARWQVCDNADGHGKLCKELRAVHLDFPAKGTGQNQRTAMDNNNNDRDCPNNTETHNIAGKNTPTPTEDNKNTKADHTPEPQQTPKPPPCSSLSPIRRTRRRNRITPLPRRISSGVHHTYTTKA